MSIQAAELFVRVGGDTEDAEAGIGTVDDMLNDFANSAGKFGAKMSLGITAPLVLMGKEAFTTAMGFQDQMNIMDVAVDDSVASLEDLSATALAVGADTDLVGISASEAADAMTGFFRAGLDVNQVMGDMDAYLSGATDLMGGLRSSIDLAAASELGLAQAQDLSVIAMKTFNMTAQEAGDIANSYVQAADASVASVGELAASLYNVGPIAAALNQDLDTVNQALAILSDRGIRGADAGTAIKSMLTHLTGTTPKVTAALEELNLKLYDQEGHFRALPDIIADMEQALSGLNEEQRNQMILTLSGTYGQKALNTLLQEGAKGWDEMSEQIEKAATASESAEGRTKGVSAAIEQFHGSVETFMIETATPFIEDFITPAIRWMTELVGKLGDMDPALRNAGLALGAVLAVVGPLALGLAGVATILGALAAPVGLTVVALAAIAAGFAAWKTKAHEQEQADQALMEQVYDTTTSYEGYIAKMREAGLIQDALEEKTYDLVKAHEMEAAAAYDVQAMVNDWRNTATQVLREEAEAAAAAAAEAAKWQAINEKGADIYTAQKVAALAYQETLDQWAESLGDLEDEQENHYLKLIQTDEVLREVATAHGLITEAQAEAAEHMQMLTEYHAALSEAQEIAREDAERLAKSTGDMGKEAEAAVFDMAAAWEEALETINDASSEFADENEQRLFDHFQRMQDGYVANAVSIQQLVNQRDAALSKLQNEYQTLALRLQKAGDAKGLAQLNVAHKKKHTGILAYYGVRIKTEKTAQDVLMAQIKRYYMTTLSIMMIQLRAQVQTVAANMIALVKMTVGGYASMTAAVVAYNKAKKGLEDIGALKAAMKAVQDSMKAIGQAGADAAQSAADEFAAWEDANAGLGDSLDDLSGKMPGEGSGSSVKETIIDPIEEAAKAASRIEGVVTAAGKIFEALAEWVTPDTGWELKFGEIADTLVIMIQRWAVASDEIKNAGLLDEEARNALYDFTDVAREVAGAFISAGKAWDTLLGFEWSDQDPEPVIEWLAAFSGMVTSAFMVVSEWSQFEGLDTAFDDFTEGAGKAVKLIGNVAKAWETIRDYQTDYHIDTHFVIEWLAAFSGMVTSAFMVVSEWSQFGGLDTAFDDFTEGAGKAVKLIGNAAKAWETIRDYQTDWHIDTHFVIEWLAAFSGMVTSAVMVVSEWSQFGGLDTAFDNYTNGAGRAVKLIGNMAKAWETIREIKGRRSENFDIQAVIDWMSSLTGIITTAIMGVSEWSQFGGLDTAFDNYTNGAGRAVKLIGNMAKAWETIREIKGRRSENFDIQAVIDWMSSLTGIITTAVMGVSEWAQFRGLDTAFDDFTEGAGKAVKLISNMAKAWETIREIKGRHSEDFDTQAVINWLADTVGLIGQEVIKLQNQGGLNFGEEFQAFTANLEAAFGPLMDAVDFVRSLEDFKPPEVRVPTVIKWLAKQAKLIGQEVIKLQNQGGLDFGEEFQAFTANLEAAFGPLMGASDLMRSLRDFRPVTRATMRRFVSDAVYLFKEFRRMIDTEFSEEAAAVTNAVSEAMGNMASGMSGMFDLFIKLTGSDVSAYSLTERFKTNLQQVIKAIDVTMNAFKIYVEDRAGNEWIPTANDFYDSMSTVLGLLGDALSLFDMMHGAQIPSASRITAIVDAIMQMYSELSVRMYAQGRELGGDLLGGIADAVGGTGGQAPGGGRELAYAYAADTTIRHEVKVTVSSPDCTVSREMVNKLADALVERIDLNG